MNSRLLDSASVNDRRKIWLLASMGFLFEGLDLTIVGGVLAALLVVFHISDSFAGLIGSTALAGYVIGVAFAGWAGDRFGRKFVMQYTLLTFCIITILAAFSWNAGVFATLRFLTGIGVGGESAIITPYLAEIMPAKTRGRFLGIADAMFTVGAVVASVLSLIIIPAAPWGWRLALIIAGLPAAYVLVIRRKLPESPLWLASKGKADHSDTTHDATSAKQDGLALGGKSSLLVIWGPDLAGRTILLWITWFFIELVYYGFLVWIPSMLVKRGFTLTKSLEYSFFMNLAALAGGVIASMIQDTRLGRKTTIILFFILAGISSFFFSKATDGGEILAAGCGLSFLLNGLFSMLYTFTPEQYPTRVRATGQGFASAFGHIGGTIGPLLIGLTLADLGMGGVFGLFTLFLIVPIFTTLFLKEMAGKEIADSDVINSSTAL